jgi:hypothetical protein
VLLLPKRNQERRHPAGELVPAVEAGVAGTADGDEKLLIIITRLPVVDTHPGLAAANLAAAVTG